MTDTHRRENKTQNEYSHDYMYKIVILTGFCIVMMCYDRIENEK